MKLRTVNFGLSKAGLSTVGYTLYKSDGTGYASRSTSGVFEIGSTGIYGARIDIPEREEIMIIWDTGGASPRYGLGESPAQLDKIQEETDKVRVIWNTLKNMGDMYAALSSRIEKFKIPKAEKADILSAIKKIIPLKIKDIKDALNVTVKPEIKIPEVKIPKFPTIPDYSAVLKKILTIVNSFEGTSKKILLNTALHNKKILSLEKELSSLITNSLLHSGLKEKLESIKKEIVDSIEENGKIDKMVKDLAKANIINDVIKGMAADNNDKDKLRVGLGLRKY